MTDSGDACRSDSLPCHVQDASLQLMRKCVTFFDNVSPCTPCFQAFLTEIELLVQFHFKAFLVKLRKARVQYLRSVPDDLFRFAVGASVHIVGQPCLDDVAFLTVDGFCAESGNLDVGVSDAKELKSVVHEHFKAFFRK